MAKYYYDKFSTEYVQPVYREESGYVESDWIFVTSDVFNVSGSSISTRNGGTYSFSKSNGITVSEAPSTLYQMPPLTYAEYYVKFGASVNKHVNILSADNRTVNYTLYRKDATWTTEQILVSAGHYVRGTYIETIVAENGTYPTDGQSGSYWYVRGAAVPITTNLSVKVNGAWKDAEPYIKVNGVWKSAESFVKVNGAWKQ